MDVRAVAIGLLAVNIITCFLLIAVMRKQIGLIRLNITDLQPQRIAFLALSATAFLGQFAPLAIVLNAILFDITATGRAPSTLGLFYAVSNGISALILSIILWTLYYRPIKPKPPTTA